MPPLNEPIRILRVIARLNVGGPALHVTYLTQGLEERGYTTTLVAGAVGEGEGSMEHVVRAAGIEPVFVPQLQRELSPLRDTTTVLKLRRLIEQERPHIVHTHTAKAGAVGRAAALAAGRHRPAVVVHTFHGHVLRGYFTPSQAAFFRTLECGLAKVSDALVAVSPEVRDDLVQLGVADASKISVIRLGLDLAARVSVPPGTRELVRAQLAVPADDTVVFGWFGRMTEIKRVEDLLQAFALVRAAGVDALLALVGDGPLRPQLELLAAELGVAERCRFVGYKDDVGSFYAGCDAVVLTSANEGTPVSLIEALAAGLPVVSTAVGGVPDVVRDGVNGTLVGAGDIAAIGAALIQLADDRALRDRLGAAARSDVMERYAVPRLVDDVDRLYRTLLAAKGEGATRRTTRRRAGAQVATPLTPMLPRPQPIDSSRRLRVLLFSQYFPPEVGATQSRMQSFAEHLAGRGHDVTVVCEMPSHPHGVLPPEYAGKVVEDDRSNPFRVLRVWVKTDPSKNQKTRLELYLSYMALATAVAPRAGRPDVVIATSPPLFTAVAGAAVARLTGAPFVLDVRDLWPAAAISLEQISGGASYQLSRRIERWLYREAAAVVAVTRPFCDHIDGLRSGGPLTSLVPNGTLDLFFEAVEPTGREALVGGREGFLVTFAGTHGIAQALPSTIDAAALAGDGVRFAYIGEGPLKPLLRERVEEHGLTNVTFHPQVPTEAVPRLLAASDALLVPLSAHPTFADFIPSKLIDAMATGKPVLLSAAGESARILARSGAGIAVPPEDPQALADAALKLAADPELCRDMGARGREFARRRLRSTQAERLEAVLLDVTGRQPA